MKKLLSICALVGIILAGNGTAQANPEPDFDHFTFTIGSITTTGWPYGGGTAQPYLDALDAALDGTLVSRTVLGPEETMIWPGGLWDYGSSMIWLNNIKEIPPGALVELRYTISYYYTNIDASYWWKDGVLFDVRAYYKMDENILGSGDKASNYATQYWQESDGTYTFAKANWLYNLTWSGGSEGVPPAEEIQEVLGSVYTWDGYIKVYTGDYLFDDSQGYEFKAVYAHFGEEDPWGNMQVVDPGCLVTGGTVFSSGSIYSQFVVPGEGMATGGGWFIPDVSHGITSGGKATFGFVAKQKSDKSSGQLEFQYHADNLNLKSTSYDWVTLSATQVMFEGEGTLNGVPGQKFRVRAVDGDKTGTGIDRFEIRIWIGTGAWDMPTYRAEGDLSGGQIVVHKK